MAVACGIVDHILEARDFPRGAPWLVGDTQSDDNPNINGLTTAIFALITYAYQYFGSLNTLTSVFQVSEYSSYLALHINRGGADDTGFIHLL